MTLDGVFAKLCAMKHGILLINLGTPDHCDVTSVRRYLNEFLMDPYVIDIPYPLRLLLVKGIILRFRPRASAELYQKIWTDRGSPLLVISQDLTQKVQQAVAQDTQVVLGMRYGNPSIASAVATLMQHQLETLTVLPLFPQYSQAATESAIQAFKKAIASYTTKPKINIIEDFYNHPAFINAYTDIIAQHLDTEHHEHLLMSYHGLPVKHLENTGCQHVGKHCLDKIGCPAITKQNARCYRAQCYATTHALADNLNLKSNQYSVSFQSRLGKTPWIKPYTDLHLPELYKNGIRRLAVVCPSFVADCLETLEEIAMRAKEQWQELGGTSLSVIPCLNSSDMWVKAITQLTVTK